MPGPDHRLVDLGLGCGTLDTAHGGWLADVVDLADERQHRAGDVGESDQLPIDGEPAGHHAVVRDELREQFGHRRPRPGDPALAVQEAALLFARKQRFAIVQLKQELDARLGGLDRVEQLETRACQPARDVDAVEDVIGQETRHAHAEVGGKPAGKSGQGVHGRPERHDARDILGPAVGGGLVAEHPALRVAGEMHVVSGGVLDRVDGLTQRDDVIGQRAVHAAVDLVGRAVVDHPGIQAGGVQDADGTLLLGDVPHIGRHHHRVDHEHRRSGGLSPGAVVRREVAPELVHRSALDDLERRGHRPGLQTAPAGHLVPVLGGGHQPLQRSRDRRSQGRQVQIGHICLPASSCLPRCGSYHPGP